MWTMPAERSCCSGSRAHMSGSDVEVVLFLGLRSELLPLFARADDSPAEIEKYFELGEVFVARREQRIIGHVQLIDAGADWEIKSLAVMESERGQGIGRALVREAIKRAISAGAGRVLVATATADIGNLRFYQRLGFRMESIERDAFHGYPVLEVDGIPLRRPGVAHISDFPRNVTRTPVSFD
jgi:ribosomal protein S18 acetylase RimI-like enzyme